MDDGIHRRFADISYAFDSLPLRLSLTFIAAELKLDVLREREVKDSLERQLSDEQKLRGELNIERGFWQLS